MSYALKTADAVAFACARKTRYSSEQVAREAGQKSIRRDSNSPARLWPYACAACRRWHLTKERGASPAITAEYLREGLH